jgi:ShK domain-like
MFCRFFWLCFALVIELVISQAETINSSCHDDDTELCISRGEIECDSNPSFMLLHCQKTCNVCMEGNPTQDAGIGSIPFDESLSILKISRQTNRNRYYLKLWHYTGNNLEDCIDDNTMCAFWYSQGQCDNYEYSDFMYQHCPLSCHRCHIKKARAFISLLLHDLSAAYHQDGTAILDETSLVSARQRSLSVLMQKIGMDPSLLEKSLDVSKDGNWLLQFHSKLHELIPPCLTKLYRKSLPNDNMDGGTISDFTPQDIQLLVDIHGMPESRLSLHELWMPYRSRGFIFRIMAQMGWDTLVTRPAQLSIAFAIPNEHALKVISNHEDVGPLIEFGAGSAYWAAILKQLGVDILTYDIRPPLKKDWDNAEATSKYNSTDPEMSTTFNAFFEFAFTQDVKQGACTEVLSENNTLAEERTLLLIWPNDPDPVDNTQYCAESMDCEGSEPVWDSDCLLAYLQAGGKKVIYVGEREERLKELHQQQVGTRNEYVADCGISSTRRFQTLLTQYFSLKTRIEIPNWWLNEDDLTIWERINSPDFKADFTSI